MEKHRFNLHLPGLLKVLAEHLRAWGRLLRKPGEIEYRRRVPVRRPRPFQITRPA